MNGKGLFSKKSSGPSVSLSEGRLTIDCTACGGASDISDIRCAACICDIVKNTGELECIHLRSAADTMYLGEAADIIRELASVRSLLCSDLSDRRGRRCVRCRKSFSHLVEDQIPLFPDIDVQALRDRAAQTPADNDVCRVCLNDSARIIDEIGAALDAVGSRLNAEEGE